MSDLFDDHPVPLREQVQEGQLIPGSIHRNWGLWQLPLERCKGTKTR